MATELDPRVVKVSVEVNNVLKIYEGLAITASGTKYANETQDEVEVKIANLDKATRDYLLTETSPFSPNKVKKKIIIEAGRESYGTTQIFQGEITSSSVSQPPDITVTLKALTGNFQKGNVVARTMPSQMSLKKIAESVAKDLGATLDFQATDKQIGNYSFTGAALKQVNKLQAAGGVDAFLDGETLIVKNMNVPLKGRTRKLNLDSGMIGIPELNEHGIKVTFLLDNLTTIGSALEVTSKLYPACNGTYSIYKLGFDIASRDTPFYYVAEAKRL